MFKVAAIAMTAATAATGSEEEVAFENYIDKFERNYATAKEKEMRFEIFKQNFWFVRTENAKNGTSTAGLNFLSDWTQKEKKQLLGYMPRKQINNSTDPKEVFVWDGGSLRDEINWVTKGAVTPVKNQGQCGSCWAFSTTGSVESAEFLSTGKLQSFSEQQLVDCSKQNNACKGGLMDNAFKYIETNPLMTEADYPYTGTHSFLSRCKYEKSKGVGKVKDFKDVTTDSSGANLKAALAQGPVSVAIEADTSVFQTYTSGVITSSACGTKLDHGVLAVGYGTESGEDYFLVKNSWGASWGVDGYVKIGAANVCGILAQPSFPTESKKPVASGTIQV